jgi:3D (Asp-Asp-Asp) domain-containing protein
MRSFASKHTLRIVLPLTLLVFLSGGSLYYWHSNSVRLTADGQTRRIFSKAQDLKGFLEEQHIVLGPSDFIVPPLDTAIEHNTAAKITRVTTDIIEETTIGTPVITWQTRTRENLRRVLVQKGYASVLKKKIQITKHDGLEISRATLSEAASRQPFFHLNFFDKSGQPGKQYDLLKCKMLKMRSTGYYVGEKTVPSDVTYLGHKLQRGLVAVDPKVIPLGTRLYVERYGYAYASDTGSAIKGLRIDLAVKDKYEEVRFNRHNLPVYILEKTKRW